MKQIRKSLERYKKKVNLKLTGEAESLVNPGITTTMGVVSSLDMPMFLSVAFPETVKGGIFLRIAQV